MFRGVKPLFFALAVCLTLGAPVRTAAQAGGHPLTFDDLMAVKRVGTPVLSPDGKYLAYTVTEINKSANRGNADIWIVPTAGGEARRLTTFDRGDTDPCWSPDGKSIAFVSARDGASQVWMVGIDGGDARKVTEFFTDLSGLIWSPDGKWMAFTADIYPECPSDDCNKQKLAAAESSKVKAKIADRLLYRHWNAWKEGRRSHIFVVPASGGPARDLTPGDHDAPPFSLGGSDYAFSADGTELAFACNTEKNEATSTNNDIFLVPVTGGPAKRVSTSPGSDVNPRYSPDGKYVAWLSQATAGFEADRKQVILFERATGKLRSLTDKVDVSFDEITWSPDSARLYLTGDQKAQVPIFSVSLAGNDVKPIFAKGANHGVEVSKDGQTLYFSHSTAAFPAELFSIKTTGGAPTQLTRTNADWLAGVKMPEAEEFWFDGAAGAKVHGMLFKPPMFDASRKYPLVYLIHGGPQGAWSNSWGYRWNPQVFAAAGYVVAMVNPRGSTGYGQKFTDEISGDWGGKVYEDLMKGLDHVVKLGYVDPNRMGAAGGSYGGYMVNWILGHSDRFKALVSHAGVYNLESMAGVTEELWFSDWEFKGTSWDNPALYEKWSPNKHVKNFKTPTLVIHGELDYRVPVGEGLQLFTALQRRNVPSKLLVFPDEGHWILKPQNSELWYKTVLEWFETYLAPTKTAAK